MKHLVLAISMIIFAADSAAADNWPAWRGADGIGVARETGFPLRWSETENVRWRVALPGPGNSTPVVWGKRVFVTQAEDQGKKRGLLCFDRADGTLLWKQQVTYDGEQPTHKTNPYCSSSPATDGEMVVAWHGSAGLHAYDIDGKPLWSRDLGEFQHIWGTASSPVIYQDRIILTAGPGLHTFLIALEKQSGKELWRATPEGSTSEELKEFRGSWSTPVLHQAATGDQFILSLPNRLIAFDPASGEIVWECGGLSKLAYTSPLVGEGFAVAMSGYHGPALATRLGGKGDVTETHRAWHHTMRNPQRIGSGVIVDGHIYILNENGVAWCIELDSGEILWQERLGKRGGGSWSSMVHADGRLYVVNLKGTTIVLEPNPEERTVLAENPVGEMTRGSLAFSDGQIFIRTYEHLYCIEDGAGN